MRNILRFGKFGELTLMGKAKKEWQRHLSRITLPEQNSCNLRSPRDYLAICAIMKNEGRYIPEWIEFHRLVGVERFYLYDNDSTDNSREILRPWIEDGIVRLMPWPNFIARKNAQYLAYAHAAALTAHTTRWLACLDLDEFLFPVVESDLRVVLRELEAARSIAVFRREFTFCGHEEPPAGPVIANYNLTTAPTQFSKSKYKSITDPISIQGVRSAHSFELQHGINLVNENLEPLRKDSKRRLKVCSEKLRINHYFTKSKSEFHEKLSRGNIAGREDWREKVTKVVTLLDNEATHSDNAIHKFLPMLMERLEKSEERGRSTTPRAS